MKTSLLHRARVRSSMRQRVRWGIAVRSALLLTLVGCSSEEGSTIDGGTMDGGQTPDTHVDAADGGSITVNRPELVPATDERIATLKVPADFQVGVFAHELVGARMLAVGPNDSVYVTMPVTAMETSTALRTLRAGPVPPTEPRQKGQEPCNCI